MTLSELQQALTAQGIYPKLENGRFKVDAPKGALTSELKAALVEHKNAIVSLLNQQQGEEADTQKDQVTDLGLDHQEPPEIHPLILKYASLEPLFERLPVVSQTKVAERILEEVSRELSIPHSLINSGSQMIAWVFEVCIHHARENNFRDFGKSGPDEIVLRGNCRVDEVSLYLHQQFQSRFSDILGYTNPHWDWSLQLTLPPTLSSEG